VAQSVLPAGGQEITRRWRILNRVRGPGAPLVTQAGAAAIGGLATPREEM